MTIFNKKTKVNWLEELEKDREANEDKTIHWSIAKNDLGIWIEKGFYQWQNTKIDGTGTMFNRLIWSSVDYYGRVWYPEADFSGVHKYDSIESAIKRLSDTENFTNVDFSIKYIQIV